MYECAAEKTPQRLYQFHKEHSLQCSWVQEVMEAWKAYYQAEEDRYAAELQAYNAYLARQKQQQQQKAEQARMLKEQQNVDKEAEEARLAAEAEKAKAEAFPCRRCPAKYPSNTKLHEHVRNHHAKKLKPAVSSTPSTPTSTHSAASLPESPNHVTTPKPPQSVSSPPFTPNRSPLSGPAPEFVPKRSGNTSTCPLTPPHTPPQKPAPMQLTPPSKSAFNTSTKPYLTIHDLYIMFAGKSMRKKPFSSQKSLSSPGVSAPRQARITSYFLPTSKSTKSEASTPVPAPVNQSARASPPRSPFHSPRPPYSPSVQPSFSTTSCSPPVCWRCQGPFATCSPSDWT